MRYIGSLNLMLMLAVPAVFSAAPAWAQSRPDPVITLPPDIKWSGRPGANQSVVLLGERGKPGLSVSLLNWVSGNISKPHYRTKDRTFIVLKGHWDFGSGPKFDVAAMKALPEGSVVTVPAGGIFYDGCKQAPCLVQIIGDGADPEFMVDEAGKTIPHEERR